MGSRYRETKEINIFSGSTEIKVLYWNQCLHEQPPWKLSIAQKILGMTWVSDYRSFIFGWTNPWNIRVDQCRPIILNQGARGPAESLKIILNDLK